jgi:hypothetical protein
MPKKGLKVGMFQDSSLLKEGPKFYAHVWGLSFIGM